MHTMKSVMISLLLFADSVTLMAQAGRDNPEKQMQEVLRKVELNKEQRARVKEIRESQKAKLQALRTELDQKRRDLDRLLDNHGEDAAVREAFQAVQKARRELETTRFERMLSIRAVLTEQQKAAFQNLRLSERALSARENRDNVRRE